MFYFLLQAKTLSHILISKTQGMSATDSKISLAGLAPETQTDAKVTFIAPFFNINDAVWMKMNGTKLAGVIQQAQLSFSTRTTEPVKRVCVRLPSRINADDIRLMWQSDGLKVVDTRTNEVVPSQDIHQPIQVMPAGTILPHGGSLAERIRRGGRVEVPIGCLSANVGKEIADILSGWHWFWEKDKVNAEVLDDPKPVYRVLAQWQQHRPSIESVDSGESGEMYFPISASCLSSRNIPSYATTSVPFSASTSFPSSDST